MLRAQRGNAFVVGENSCLHRTPELCTSIFLFNMHIGLTHVLADKREARAHPYPRGRERVLAHSQTAADERGKVKHNTQGLHRLKLAILLRQSIMSAEITTWWVSQLLRSSCYAFRSEMLQQGKKEGLPVLLISPRLCTHRRYALKHTYRDRNFSA